LQISVIIPVYNREQSLGRALDSVLKQSSAADEIIVIDDGSNDQSARLVEQHYPQAKLIQQHNKGVSAARNSGIRAARFDWVALLDSDDEWLPDKLAMIRQAHREHSNEVLFHSDEIWIRNGVRVNPMNKHRKAGGYIFKHCLPLCVISPSAAVMQRSLFEKIGLFNESLPACEDYDLWLRLCHLYPVFYIDQPLIIKYGGHPDQLSRKYWGMDRFRILALNDLIQQNTLNADYKILTRNMLIKKCRILTQGATKHNNQQVLDQFKPILELHESESC